MTKNLSYHNGTIICNEFNAIVMDYIGACTARGAASPRTKAAYFTAISEFLKYCSRTGVNPRSAVERDIEGWRADMVAGDFSPVTIMLKLAAVRTFYKALIRAGIRADNPALDVKSPKRDVLPVDAVISKLVFPDQMIVVLGKLPDDYRGRRDRAILIILYTLALRVSEVAALSWLDYKDDLLYFISKGGIKRNLTVEGGLKDALGGLGAGVGAGPMFLGISGKRLSIRGIQKMVAARLKAAGIKSHGPHALRHSFAITAAMAGVSPYAIQDQLGHASLRTTDIYTKAAGRLMDAPSKAVALTIGL